MKINYLFLAFVVVLVFLNCSKENSIDQEIGKEVKVTATFSGMSVSSEVTTRVTDTSWEKDDAIGLFMMNSAVALDESALASNVKYITDGTQEFNNPSQNKIYYPFNKKNVDIIAYYPYDSSIKDLTYEIDVTNQIKLSDIDLLYSNEIKSVNSTAGIVNLHFIHQLVKVIIKLDVGDTGVELNKFSAIIANVNRSALFSLANGEISNKNDIGNINFNVRSNNKTAEAILLPEDDLSDKELIITIDETSFSLSLDNTAKDNKFKQSNIYTYSIALREGKGPILDGLTATIEDWIYNDIDGVYADEIPASDDDNSSNPDSPGDSNGDNNDGGDGDTNLGEEGSKDDSGDSGSGDIVPDPEAELGSQQNPYTIAGIYNISDMTGAKDIWVKGYIVGSFNPAGIFHYGDPGFFTGGDDNLALADSKKEMYGDRVLPVNLKYDNDSTLKIIYKALNLKENKNCGKEVFLRGDIGDWVAGKIDKNERLALINLKGMVFEGESYPK